MRRNNTSKALANLPAMSKISTTAVSIFLLVLRARVLLSPLFLLSVDKGRLSETRLVLGPYMIKEIEGALWPIYGVCLGGQYRIGLPFADNRGLYSFSLKKEKEDIRNLDKVKQCIK
jgi:hypothetical protein